MAAPKEIGRKPNGMGEFRPSCGYVEDNIVEVPFDKEHLLEQILSPSNLNRAYKSIMRNKRCDGIDEMSCEQLLPWHTAWSAKDNK